VNIGFTIGEEYTLMTGEFPLKEMTDAPTIDNNYQTADENTINNVYTFSDTNKTLITDIRIKNYKDYCRILRLNSGGICSIIVAQELIQLKVIAKNLFECIKTTDNGEKIGFNKDEFYSIDGGMGTVIDKTKVYKTKYTFKRDGEQSITDIEDIYITKLSDTFPENIQDIMGTNLLYTFNVVQRKRKYNVNINNELTWSSTA